MIKKVFSRTAASRRRAFADCGADSGTGLRGAVVGGRQRRSVCRRTFRSPARCGIRSAPAASSEGGIAVWDNAHCLSGAAFCPARSASGDEGRAARRTAVRGVRFAAVRHRRPARLRPQRRAPRGFGCRPGKKNKRAERKKHKLSVFPWAAALPVRASVRRARGLHVDEKSAPGEGTAPTWIRPLPATAPFPARISSRHRFFHRREFLSVRVSPRRGNCPGVRKLLRRPPGKPPRKKGRSQRSNVPL